MEDVKQESGLKDVILGQFRTNIKQYAMFFALLAIGVIFSFLTNGKFLSPRNLTMLFLQTSYIFVLAVGMVMVIVAGHIDLSVGSVAGFTGAIVATLLVKVGLMGSVWGTMLAIGLTLGAGILIGMWQGFWIAYQRIPAFIVTLAGMGIFRGALLLLTKSETISHMGDFFNAIAKGFVPRLFFKDPKIYPVHDTTIIIALVCILLLVLMENRSRRIKIRYGFQVSSLKIHYLKVTVISVLIAILFLIFALYRGVPYSAILIGVLVLLFTFVTNNTVFGRHVYAIGGNREAARLSGININRINMLIFMIMGFLGALAGIVYTSRMDSAAAQAGELFELETIAAAIIGGTSTLGGEGTIVGAVIGALVMSSLNNGMDFVGLEIWWQKIVKGLVLILAVWLDMLSKRKKS